MPAIRPEVPTSAVVRSLERVIFQARVARDDRASGQHFADGHWLEIFWQPLRPKPVLAGPQQICLDSVYAQLLSR